MHTATTTNECVPHLPVQLAVVDHGEHAQRLDLDDGAHGQRPRSDLNDVDRVVVPEALQLRVLQVGILPGLGEAAVVPEDRAVVIPQLALLDVLRDGVVRFLRRDLHLRLGHLGNLDDGVVVPAPSGGGRRRPEGDVVPGGDRRLALAGEGQPEGFRRHLPDGRGRVGAEDGRGDDNAPRRLAARGPPGRGGGPCGRRRRGA